MADFELTEEQKAFIDENYKKNAGHSRINALCFYE